MDFAGGDMEIRRTLGRGSTATVSLATSAAHTFPFAVKCTHHHGFSPQLRREYSILSSLSSPNIISCLGADDQPSTSGGYRFFMEYAAGGSLADEMNRNQEPAVRYCAASVLRGLAYLHSAGVVHCDIKPRNILLSGDGVAKIADFGCARRIADSMDKTFRGTPMFMSPEVARGEEQGEAADIWALGCTVLELVTGKPAWPSAVADDPISVLHKIAFSSDAPEIPSSLPDETRDFLEKCLRRDAGERWTAEQLLRHPFCTTDSGKWLSPKSIIDQDFWDSQEDCEDDEVDTPESCPEMSSEPAAACEIIRQLATGAPEWESGSLDWITVRTPDPQPDKSQVRIRSSDDSVAGVPSVGPTTKSAGEFDNPKIATDVKEDEITGRPLKRRRIGKWNC